MSGGNELQNEEREGMLINSIRCLTGCRRAGKLAAVWLLASTGILTGGEEMSERMANPAPVILRIGSEASAREGGGLYRVERRGDGRWEVTDFVSAPGLNYTIWSRDRQRLYGTLSETGELAVFRLVDDGRTRLETRVPALGTVSCHLVLSPDERFLYVANYGDGTLAEYRMEGGLPTTGRGIRHAGNGPTPRQEGPHAHFVGFTPDGAYLAAVDLGIDAVLFYEYDPVAGVKAPAAFRAELPPGTGPRHLVWRGEFFFVAGELGSTVSSFRWRGNMPPERIATISTLPDGVNVENYPAAIRNSPDGRFLLVSNRGQNTLAVLTADGEGQLRLLRTVPTGGDWPRDFAFEPDGRHLWVANERSGTICRFRYDAETGTPQPTAEAVTIRKGLCVAFD